MYARYVARHYARHRPALTARATLESIALQTYDVLDVMQKETGIELSSCGWMAARLPTAF